MRPVHEFKTNFSQTDDRPPDTTGQAPLTEGVKAGIGPTDALAGTKPDHQRPDVESHDAESGVRNLCFIWPDGRKAFFNYAYLVSVDLVLTDTINTMLLYFSGQIVTLKGYRLGLLFDLLLNHTPKTITASHSRYDVAGQTLDSFVTEILVKNE